MQYFGKGTHLSFVLKRDIHRAREARPDMFSVRFVKQTSMDGDGKVTVTESRQAKATAPTGKQRHTLSLQRERY